MKPPKNKYVYSPFVFKERTWPDKQIAKAPLWCSVDLRDGNQALSNPMNLEKKLKLFACLVKLGFKEIEIGFPAAAAVEYNFARHLIENNLIPSDVTIQVLTQARKELIEKTMRAIEGAPRAIVHLYNSTSTAQRKIVFKKERAEIIEIATQGVRWIKELLPQRKENIILQYSPESFTGTEAEFSLEICEAVLDAWGLPGKKIINLPATVELFGPQVYADLVEWMSRHLKRRQEIILSVHTHNDRGTGVAASELGLLAGAERVEGTLFGNGERTGNVDLVTLALNLYMHGIDPQLDLSDLNAVAKISEACTELPVEKRHPYAGELVFTAFSGSHQDAIAKGFAHQKKFQTAKWEVPYLAIDPKDIGRSYEALIRINSQSGKGGLLHVMEREFGYQLPRELQIEFSSFVQAYANESEKEVASETLLELFNAIYIQQKDLSLKYISALPSYLEEGGGRVKMVLKCQIRTKGQLEERRLVAEGNGPLNAAKKALESLIGNFELTNYKEHAVSSGSRAEAISYVQLEQGGVSQYGVGLDRNITVCSVKALFSAVNLLLKKRKGKLGKKSDQVMPQLKVKLSQ